MNVNARNDQSFLKRLTVIVESNLTNDHFGVSELAREFGKSRSYIHRRLKSLNNESISQFVRNVKLKRAVELLESGELTVSEIAYETGFGSPSYFIKCFHEYFGYSPGEFAKQEIETSESKEVSISPNLIVPKKMFYQERKWQMLGLVFIFIVLLFIGNKFILNESGQPDLEKSVAVLPFKNLSGDEDNKYFADGMMDDILNHLSHINDFTVKARTSTEQYRNSEKSMPIIAKELGVSYVIEGTVQKYNNRVKLIIQLHDYNGDDVWSDSFDRELSDIFKLQSEIAKQVAMELKTVLSPQELKQIEKGYTSNTEAYKLYQKGRFFWHKRTEEDVNRSIYYFNEALKYDSSFALAYAGLADAYFIEAWYKWMNIEEAINKSKLYAQNALEIDNTLAEVHAVLGGIACWFDCDWRTSEKELKRAIELNPNSAIAHQYYSEYLDIVNRGEEARKHIEIAIDLNPNFKINYTLSSVYFYHAENYEMALKVGEKVLELDKNYMRQNWLNFKSYLKLGNDSLAINELLKIALLQEATSNYKNLLFRLYKETDMEAIILWILANRELILERNSTYNVVTFYLYLNQQEKALDLLEKYYVEGIIPFQRINCDPDFNSLRENPRFVALLEKMNLPVK